MMKDNGKEKYRKWGCGCLYSIIGIAIVAAIYYGNVPSDSTPADTFQSQDTADTLLTSPYGKAVYNQQRKDKERPTDEAYRKGYDEGFEQGKSDGKIGFSHAHNYDDSNKYQGSYSKRYKKGYEDGYEEGYIEGWADYEDAQEEENEDEDEDITDDW